MFLGNYENVLCIHAFVKCFDLLVRLWPSFDGVCIQKKRVSQAPAARNSTQISPSASTKARALPLPKTSTNPAKSSTTSKPSNSSKVTTSAASKPTTASRTPSKSQQTRKTTLVTEKPSSQAKTSIESTTAKGSSGDKTQNPAKTDTGSAAVKGSTSGKASTTSFTGTPSKAPTVSTGAQGSKSDSMASDSIDLILIGRSGTGKSATANSILDREVFKRNPRSASFAIISEPKKESRIYRDKAINVVDGLNVGEGTSDDHGDIDRDIASLKEAFKLCNNGFSALLIVVQFGVQFSEEETEALKVLKSILGENVIKRFGICVITHGDNYQHALDEEEFKTFDEWRKQQTKELQAVIKECDDRYVIFNNRSKDKKEKESQVELLYRQILGLSKHGKRRYEDKDLFEAAKHHESLRLKRQPIEVEQKVTLVTENVRQRLKDIQRDTSGADATCSKLKDLEKELTDLSKHVVETVGENSAVSERCVPEIQALYMEISSQIKKLDLDTKVKTRKELQGVQGVHSGDIRASGRGSLTDVQSHGASLGQMKHPLDGRDERGSEEVQTGAERLIQKQSQKIPLSNAEEAFLLISSRAKQAKENFQNEEAKYSSEIESLIGELKLLRDRVYKTINDDPSSLQLLADISSCEGELRKIFLGLQSKKDTSVAESGVDVKKIKLVDDPKMQPSNVASTVTTTVTPTVTPAVPTRNKQGTERSSEKDSAAKTVQKKTTPLSAGDSVDLLLMGRTGNGRSATGNTILGIPAFKASASTSAASGSGTSKILRESAEVDGVTVNVIDGPGINDSEDTQHEDLEIIVNAVEKSMELCDYGFSALLIVLKFGLRFTKQEVDCIKVIKSVLGKNVIRDYGICVVTHGDNFDREAEDMAEEGEEMNFKSWCEGQDSDVRDLFEECDFRCVLFDNKTKDESKKETQRKKLLSMIDAKKRYSKQEFLTAEEGLQELTFEAMFPQLEQEAQKLNDQVRQEIIKFDKEKSDDPNAYKTKMEEMLREVKQFKENVQEMGHDAPSVFQITTQVSLLEIEIRSKIDQQRRLDESKGAVSAAALGTSGMETSPSVPRSSTVSVAGPFVAEDINALKQQTQIVLTDVRTSANALDRQNLDGRTYVAEMQGLLDKLKRHQQHVENVGQSSDLVNPLAISISQMELEIYHKIKDRRSADAGDWVPREGNRPELKYPHPPMQYPGSGYPQMAGGERRGQPVSYEYYGAYESRQQVVVVKEYAQGEDLGDLIKKKWKKFRKFVATNFHSIFHGRSGKAYRGPPYRVV